jgi:hypothetical protein
MLEDLKCRPRGLAIILLVGFLGLLTGCASGPAWDENQRGILEQRVRERWLALEARDFEKAWEYTSPTYRARFSKQLYAKKFSYAVTWELTEVEIVNYDSAAAVASVVARVMSEPTKHTSSASVAIGAIPNNLRERWIFAEGQWWYSANY